MSKGIPLAEFTAQFMTEQRAHYDARLSEFVRNVEALDVDDEVKCAAVEHVRAFLAIDLDRCEREVAALVARGMRTDESLH